MVGVSTFWQTVIKGLVIVLAVMLDQGQQRLKNARAAAVAAQSVKRELAAHHPRRSSVSNEDQPNMEVDRIMRRTLRTGAVPWPPSALALAGCSGSSSPTTAVLILGVELSEHVQLAAAVKPAV